MKKIFIFLVFILLPLQKAHALNVTPPSINIYLEGYNNTIARGESEGFTFEEALKKFSEKENVTLTFVYDENSYSLNSVAGIENNTFNIEDKWNGYVVRDDEVISPDNFLNFILNKNDILVLYYGLEGHSKIISSFRAESKNNNVFFNLESENITWVNKSNIWIKENTTEVLDNLRIHLETLSGTKKILRTDSLGNANIFIDTPRVFRYFAEGYKEDSVPDVIKTPYYTKTFGFNDVNKITRAETVSFIMNTFDFKELTTTTSFIDVPKNHQFYDDILSATSCAVIIGDKTGNFYPEKPINFTELCIMISAIPIKNDKIKDNSNNFPKYARVKVDIAYSTGLLEGINLAPDDLVSDEIFMKIYLNSLNH